MNDIFGGYLKNLVTDMHKEGSEKARQAGIMTLGGLIEKLSSLKQDNPITYDFGSLGPTKLKSYRGTYSELALGYEEDSRSLKVSDLLKICKDAMGKTFEGYKGGDYVMGENTPVWVANYGNSGDTAITDVIEHGYGWANIVTAEFDL